MDEYEIDASMDLDDLNHLLDVDFPTEESDTLGGYIYSVLGRIPTATEVIETDRLRLTVLSIDGRRIRKVHAKRKSGQQLRQSRLPSALAAGAEGEEAKDE